MEIPIRYNFKAIEEKIYQLWLDNHCFDSVYDTEGHPRNASEANKKPFAIVIPPPNVTGRLHMGHALNSTVQDVLIRYKRMDGYDALWVPGTDHAGISTQTVVRKHLDAKGIDYREIGRTKFIETVWEWKAKYGDIILQQLRKIGCSCDWRRTRFTMDEGLSRAVRVAFKQLYDQGLIYRGKRIVNWCPVDRTALSDDEVNTKDGGEKSHLWYIRYPLEKTINNIKYITVATTRPETLFGDVAIAVNPKDKRYQILIGKNARLPLNDRIIPIIGDNYVDPSFGTGALKITPAHDLNDFEVGQRHDLEPIEIMNEDASLNEVVPKKFRGLDRYIARNAVVKSLEEQGLLPKIEDRMVPVGRAQRSGAVIEYRLSDQWFVRMKPLAEKALKASGFSVREGEWVKVANKGLLFHPVRWEKVYKDWLSRIRDWTISRQIWWGHRIPAWYHNDTGEVLVDIETPDTVRQSPTEWHQDPDVLDTWFSSWLWPMSTLGWPENTADLQRYYPTSVLSTSKDIIFFWVARMNFAGLAMTKTLPYRNVYIHPTVLDDRGAVMSKSKGNGLDPLAVIDGADVEQLKAPIFEARPNNMKELLARVEKNFPNGFEGVGADAQRFTLIYSCSDGQETRLSLQRFNDIGRRFITKLWNASRYVLLALDNAPGPEVDVGPLAIEDRWIRSRLASTSKAVRFALDQFDFAPVGQTLYRFTWNDYCDWFLELTKARINGDVPENSRRAAHELGRTLADTLRLLHPVIPFITEELWGKLQRAMDKKALWLDEPPNSSLLVTEHFPTGKVKADAQLEALFETLQRLVTRIRQMRANAQVADTVALDVKVNVNDDALSSLIEKTSPALLQMARLSSLEHSQKKPRGWVTAVDHDFEIYFDLRMHIDISKELDRIQKEISVARKSLDQVSRKLNNPQFLSRANADIVERERLKNDELRHLIDKLNHLKDEYSDVD